MDEWVFVYVHCWGRASRMEKKADETIWWSLFCIKYEGCKGDESYDVRSQGVIETPAYLFRRQHRCYYITCIYRFPSKMDKEDKTFDGRNLEKRVSMDWRQWVDRDGLCVEKYDYTSREMIDVELFLVVLYPRRLAINEKDENMKCR